MTRRERLTKLMRKNSCAYISDSPTADAWWELALKEFPETDYEALTEIFRLRHMVTELEDQLKFARV